MFCCIIRCRRISCIPRVQSMSTNTRRNFAAPRYRQDGSNLRLPCKQWLLFSPRHFVHIAVIITLTAFNVVLIQKRSTLNFYQTYRDDDLFCHFADEENLPLANNHNFSARKQIFFHETSCKLGLDTRQACAIESAARLNPNWDINVFFMGPPSKMFLNSTIYKTLSQNNNIHFYRLLIKTFNDKTPMAQLSPTDILYVNNNNNLRILGNMLRYMTLYKYGGVYLDLDLISVRSLDAFPPNWVAKRSVGMLGAGALGLSKNKAGRTISEKIMLDFKKVYNPLRWSPFNAGVLTRVLRDVCATNSVHRMSNSTCAGITVFDRSHFYPIHHLNMRRYFMSGDVKFAHTYGHHLWNSRSWGMRVPRDSLLGNIAKQFCPVTYQLHGDYFGY